MNELKITKDRVLKASEACSEARAVLKELFPEVFQSVWRDITKEIIVVLNKISNAYSLNVYHKGDWIGCIYSSDGSFHPTDRPTEYKIEVDENCFRFFRKE